MKKTLAERTQQLLDELEITQVELASLAGCTKGAVNQWLKSSTTESKMDPAYAFNIADKTPYEPRWLMIGEGEERKQKISEREKALLDLYRSTDERGRSTILRAAEQESSYLIGDEDDIKRSA